MKEIISRNLRVTAILAVVFLMLIMPVMSELSFSESENGEEPEETPQEELLEEPEPEVLPPKKVKIRSVVSKKEGQAVIKWKAVECDRYQVRYARDKNFTVSVVQKNVSAKSKSLTVKGLEKGKKYYFQVRAQNNKKNKKTGKIKRVSGEWSDTVKVKIHKHHYKLDSYLTPCAGVEYTACYKCSCGSAYYKTKTNKGKIYDGSVDSRVLGSGRTVGLQQVRPAVELH